MITKEDLISYMAQELGVETSDVREETLLFSSGIIDSFALVSLITFIEEKCRFRVNPMDVTLDNLDSIDRILGYVRRCRSAHSR
jgi:Acyl carrier protein